MPVFEPDPRPLDKYMTQAQQEILAQALALVFSSPEKQGEVTITAYNGHVHYIIPAPALKFSLAQQSAQWMKRRSTPFE